jgi:BASS family bile acid:Na+ symporter
MMNTMRQRNLPLIFFLCAYAFPRAITAADLPERTCRTIAFEVGMQNGGMASGLAMDALKSASAALAPAVFGPWMNISGSLLASWWSRRPLDQEAQNATDSTLSNE